MTRQVFRFAVCAVWVSAIWAQAPSGLTVTSATNKQVVLSWSGAASTYTVQRAQLGSTYSTIGTATGAAYTDSSIDAFTTYQYRILNGSAASSSVTVGPPPSGITNAAPAPLVGASPSTTYGYNISLAFDGNGDPALIFIWDDPKNDGDHTKTALLFRSWNRARYTWNPVVTIGVVGDAAATSRSIDSLAYDPSTGIFAAISEVQASSGDQDLQLFVSTDGGATWTLKNSFHTDSTGYVGPSLALRGGNLYLAYTLNPSGLAYVTGQLNQSPATWTTKNVPPFPGFAPEWGTGPSLALDSAGNPAIVFITDNVDDYTIADLLFWRPNAGTLVKVTDSQGDGDGTGVKLIFNNLNPRIAVYLPRDDSNTDPHYGDSIHFVHSEDGGLTWQTPVLIPPDGNGSTDYPFDLALDSHDDAAIFFGQNANSGDAVCGNPKLAISTDLTHFTTCSFAPLSVTQNFSIYPSAIQAGYGANDKLYLLWLENSGDPANTGVLLYREPPANAISAPTISSVSDNNITRATIVPGSWISIFGVNLSGTTRIWNGSDFTGDGTLPTSLDGVSVKINGLPAAVYYISPTQINVQAPSPLSGSVNVQTTYNEASSNLVSASVATNAPTLFSYTVGGTTFPAAVFANSSIIVGDPALAGSIVAKPHAGDYIQLYANGLGSSPSDVVIGAPIPFSDSLTVTIGGQTAPVQFAGLVAPGEYQINVMVPSLSPGLYPVVVTAGGQSSQSGVMVPVQ